MNERLQVEKKNNGFLLLPIKIEYSILLPDSPLL